MKRAASSWIGLRAATPRAQAFDPQHGKISSAASKNCSPFHRASESFMSLFLPTSAAPETPPQDFPPLPRDIWPWIACRQWAGSPQPPSCVLTRRAADRSASPSPFAPYLSNETARALRFPSQDEYLQSLRPQAVPMPPSKPLLWPAHCERPLSVHAHDMTKIFLEDKQHGSIHRAAAGSSGNRHENRRRECGAPLASKQVSAPPRRPLEPAGNPPLAKRSRCCLRVSRDSDWRSRPSNSPRWTIAQTPG